MELYKHLVLLKKLPLNIECTYAYDDYLLIGTKEGHLLMYKIELKLKTPTEFEFKPHLLRSAKQFSRKPIVQIEAILEHRILVSLSDQIISIHNLDKISFPFLLSLPKTKGATYFSLDITRQKTLSGQIQSTVRMCVVVKYSLLFFYWKNSDFLELRPSIKLPEVAKIVVWSVNRLFVGIKNKYLQVDLDTGTVEEMFPVTTEPLIVPLPAEKNFALCRDKKTYVFDYDRKPLLDRAITWSEQPISIAEDLLFLIAVEPNSSVEVLANTLRDVIKEPLLQKNNLSQQVFRPLRTIAKWHNRPGQLVLNSDTDVVMMKIVPSEQQIQILQNARHFELAIKMIEFNHNVLPDSGSGDESIPDFEESERLKLKIRKLHAMDLFCRYKFTEAIALFQSLNTDPSFVIALFPNIFPERFRSQFLTDPISPPTLEGAILERGLMALIEYLVEIRLRVNKEIASEKSSTGLKKLHELQSIIDTSLLKCYLETNESLVASLLRIDNHCHLEETEMALKAKDKTKELIILYKTRGLHQKALSILQKQAQEDVKDNPARRQQLIHYLQELGCDHMDLLYKYSEWILCHYPDEGIKIFLDDYIDPQLALPKDDVIAYLERVNPDLVLTYLDHCIFKCNETSTKYIDQLINKYRANIYTLINQHREELARNRSEDTMEILEKDLDTSNDPNEYYLRPEPAGKEPGKLGELRRKLLHVLEVCDYYTMDTLSDFLIHDGLFEERAIVLGKMGKHREALMIYVHILNDLELAEQYCLKQYNQTNGKGSHREVFFYLLEQCLKKPGLPEMHKYFEMNEASTMYSFNMPLLLPQSVLNYLNQPQNREKLQNLEQMVQIAIAILACHSPRINLLRAMELLEDHLPLGALALILPPAIHHLGSRNNQTRILARLLKSERLKVHETRMQVERANRVIVTGTEICQFCMKKIGKSVFVRYTNKDMVHLGCRDSYEYSHGQRY